ncbi:MAG: hypothetical protein AAF581_14685 [Planctomycetota bacterium]
MHIRPAVVLLGLSLFLCSCVTIGSGPPDGVSGILRAEAEQVLVELDANGDGRVRRDEVPPEEQGVFDEVDVNGDGVVTLEELVAEFADDFEEATFVVVGDRAIMTGVICATTPTRVKALFREHPNVRAIEMREVPGSVDDAANLEAARYLRTQGLETLVPRDGEIASGGVDFFLAGASRTVEIGARLGVHSWGFDGFQGADLPREDPQHRMYLEFYEEMGIPVDFYWYTLRAAPADGVHWMTRDEMKRYHVCTTQAENCGIDPDSSYGLDYLRPGQGPRGIVALSHAVHPAIRSLFDRYTRVTVPNGKSIHILAQRTWTTDQIVRARKVLEHMLAPASQAEFGADKATVANAMADRRATLALFDDHEAMERGFRTRFGSLRLGVQDLRANECPVEGSPDYMHHQTRDAAFEEILHLVHDYGIRPALPQYDGRIQAASDAAAACGIWDPWPCDEPDSHRNEYIAAVYDNYLDLWTVPPTCYEGELIPPGEIPSGTSHFGTYQAGSRARLGVLDPKGLALVEAFLPTHLTYTPELPENFKGTFSIAYEPNLRYSAASQHLRSVQLTGSADANLVGNDHGNRLLGNSGANHFEGRGGDDVLDGAAGEDVAIFRGPQSHYTVESSGGAVRVADSQPSRDGTDHLLSVEWLRFSDGMVRAP